MGSLIGIGVMVAALLWLLGIGKAKPVAAPEDDIFTPIDEQELAEAEAELAADPEAQSIDQALDDDEDWGPGTSRSNLPGIA